MILGGVRCPDAVAFFAFPCSAAFFAVHPLWRAHNYLQAWGEQRVLYVEVCGVCMFVGVFSGWLCAFAFVGLSDGLAYDKDALRW